MKPIILADDDEDIQFMLSGIIGDVIPDVRIDQVYNGVDLVSRVAENVYGLIITDNTLPEMSGIEATKQIRSRGNKAPVIVISGDDFLEESALEAGATRFHKKTTIPSLMNSIRELYQRGE